MLGGISTSSSPASAGLPSSGPPRFDARLEAARKKLQDCLSCSSAKTPEGQRSIRAAQAKVDAIRRQAESADGERRPPPAAADRRVPTSAEELSAARSGRIQSAWIDVYA